MRIDDVAMFLFVEVGRWLFMLKSTDLQGGKI